MQLIYHYFFINYLLILIVSSPLPNFNSSNSIFFQKLKNTIQKQVQASYDTITSNPLKLNPNYAYNTILGYDPNKKIIPIHQTPISTTTESAMSFYLKEHYDDNTISKIYQNLNNVNPYTILSESPMTFLKAESNQEISQPSVSEVTIEEKYMTNPDEFQKYRFSEKPLKSPLNEFIPSEGGDRAENRNNNIFVIKNPPKNSKKVSMLDKIPIFIPIPIFQSYNVPVLEHHDFKQKIKEIIPEEIEIPVEHQTINPIPVIVQKEQKVLIPQGVPFGVKVPYQIDNLN